MRVAGSKGISIGGEAPPFPTFVAPVTSKVRTSLLSWRLPLGDLLLGIASLSAEWGRTHEFIDSCERPMNRPLQVCEITGQLTSYIDKYKRTPKNINAVHRP